MAILTPHLDLLYMDTHSKYTMAIGDASSYPTGFTISTPTIEIVVPGYNSITLPFVAQSIQVYNAATLGLNCVDSNCTTFPLPDGIYNVKYSIYPAYTYYVQKTFIRVSALQEKLDEVYLKMELMECDRALEEQDRKLLDTIQAFIDGAIAAANNCANKLAMELYRKAQKMMENYTKNRCFTKN